MVVRNRGILVSRGSPLIRQWILLKTLASRAGGATLVELAGELEVSSKTIRRDLSVFLDCGFPVHEESVEFGRKLWRLDPSWQRPELAFTFDEALALYLGRQYLEPLAGTLIWEAAQRAFKKIRASLGQPALKYLDRISPSLSATAFGIADYSRRSDVIDNLLIGIEDRKVVFITYRSQRSTEPVTYDIHPYRITRHRGSLYVHGHKPDDAEFRTWKIDRIENAEVDSVGFTMPPPRDIDQELAGSLGIYHGRETLQIQVWFSSSVARYVQESRWHPSQRLAPQPDGSLLAEFELSATEELKSWVLSFGANAEILKPRSLREEVKNELSAMLVRYRNRSANANRRATAKKVNR